MAREVDPRRTRKAQRLIDRLKREAEDAATPYSNWEETFLTEVDQRLDKYGSAFNSYEKGSPEEAVSRLQAQKLKEIAAKAKGNTKARSSLGRRSPEQENEDKPRAYSSFKRKAPKAKRS